MNKNVKMYFMIIKQTSKIITRDGAFCGQSFKILDGPCKSRTDGDYVNARYDIYGWKSDSKNTGKYLERCSNWREREVNLSSQARLASWTLIERSKLVLQERKPIYKYVIHTGMFIGRLQGNCDGNSMDGKNVTRFQRGVKKCWID